jgi:hypothetical protein
MESTGPDPPSLSFLLAPINRVPSLGSSADPPFGTKGHGNSWTPHELRPVFKLWDSYSTFLLSQIAPKDSYERDGLTELILDKL